MICIFKLSLFHIFYNEILAVNTLGEVLDDISEALDHCRSRFRSVLGISIFVRNDGDCSAGAVGTAPPGGGVSHVVVGHAHSDAYASS